MKKNEVILSLCIWNFDDISHTELSQVINLKPSKIHVKGQQINPKFKPLAKENGWILACELGKYASFEEQLEFFMDLIESKLEVFESISSKYYIELSCAVYVYCNNDESTPWIHLGSRYNNILKKSNIEFDLDLFCLNID